MSVTRKNEPEKSGRTDVPQHLHFCCFSDNKYPNIRIRMKHWCESSQTFESYHIWTEKELQNSALWTATKQAFVSQPQHRRGYGYWIWKPLVVLQTLSAIPVNHYLLYADGGCMLNLSPMGKARLQHYLDLIQKEKKAGLAFAISHPEVAWTKEDTIHAIFPELDRRSTQICSGIFIVRHIPEMISFLKIWASWVDPEHTHLLDDSPSILSNSTEFQEHRHDQSIWSLLVKKHENLFVVLPDETYSHDFPHLLEQGVPVLAARWRN